MAGDVREQTAAGLGCADPIQAKALSGPLSSGEPGVGVVAMNPDCAGGKCQACAGDAWDEINDARCECACQCHQEGR